MTYTITFLTNDKAKLVVSQTTTSCLNIALMVKNMGEKQGHIVIMKSEA